MHQALSDLKEIPDVNPKSVDAVENTLKKIRKSSTDDEKAEGFVSKEGPFVHPLPVSHLIFDFIPNN